MVGMGVVITQKSKLGVLCEEFHRSPKFSQFQFKMAKKIARDSPLPSEYYFFDGNGRIDQCVGLWMTRT